MKWAWDEERKEGKDKENDCIDSIRSENELDERN
jgi:hypothetical protein